MSLVSGSYFRVARFWVEVLEKVLATGGEHLQLKAPNASKFATSMRNCLAKTILRPYILITLRVSGREGLVVMIFISRFFGAYEPKHPKITWNYATLLVLPGAHDALAPGLAQAASFMQVGVSGSRGKCVENQNRSVSVSKVSWNPRFFNKGFNTHIGMEPLGHDLRCFAAILHSQTSQSGPCAGGFIMLLCSFQWRKIAAFLTLSPIKTWEMPYVAGTQIQKT